MKGNRNKYLLTAFFLLATAALIFVFLTRIKKGVSYFDNGQLKYEVILKDGKREGIGISYYETGEVLSKANWKDGKQHGHAIFFYKNGQVSQEGEFVEGVCLQSRDYFENGSLEELRVYDSLGRIFDVYSYKSDGTRAAKDPVFIVEKDTIVLGEQYKAFVRLGNRQFDQIDVFLGDLDDRKITQNNPALPKFDPLTAILVLTPHSPGPDSVSGVVLEQSSKSDSLDVIPFTHRFYVKERQ